MSTVATRRERGGGAEPRLRTIGSVCEELREQFPDISVSKIRYLEDQGLISPRRTRGGYRLFAPDDIERLTTILRLQRDEFLPLRVIREELDGPGASGDRTRRRSRRGLVGHEDEIDEAELCERASVSPDSRSPARGVRTASSRAPKHGERLYGESEADIAAACARLARFGIDARHLRTFLTAAGRQAALVEQLVAPGSAFAERRAPQERTRGSRGALAGRAGALPPPRRPRPARDRGADVMTTLDLRDRIRDVPDFPSEGIVFKDLMPLIADPEYFAETIRQLADWARPREPELILGAEARGFIFGAALAYALGAGFIAARKPGKLPRETVEATYALEYGTDSLQVHRDAVASGARVVVLDDVLATGGTARAKVELVEGLGGVVAGVLFVIELELPARARAACPATTCTRSSSTEQSRPSGRPPTTRA